MESIEHSGDPHAVMRQKTAKWIKDLRQHPPHITKNGFCFKFRRTCMFFGTFFDRKFTII